MTWMFETRLYCLLLLPAVELELLECECGEQHWGLTVGWLCWSLTVVRSA